MKHIALALCLSSVGCYTIGTGPDARGDARRVAIVELVSSAVVLTAGAKAQHDYDSSSDASPPDNLGPLILLTGGTLLLIAGLVSLGNS